MFLNLERYNHISFNIHTSFLQIEGWKETFWEKWSYEKKSMFFWVLSFLIWFNINWVVILSFLFRFVPTNCVIFVRLRILHSYWMIEYCLDEETENRIFYFVSIIWLDHKLAKNKTDWANFGRAFMASFSNICTREASVR